MGWVQAGTSHEPRGRQVLAEESTSSDQVPEGQEAEASGRGQTPSQEADGDPTDFLPLLGPQLRDSRLAGRVLVEHGVRPGSSAG